MEEKRFQIQVNSIARTMHVVDMENGNLIGEVDCAPEFTDWVLAWPLGGKPWPKFTAEEVAALFEELTAKMYDQMKARTLTAIEAATGQTGIGDKPLGRQIGYALDDAKRVALEVLERRAPEITPEMLREAETARTEAESVAYFQRRTEDAADEVRMLKARLASAERRLAEESSRCVRQEIYVTLEKADDEALKRIAETFRRELTGPKFRA